MRQSICTRRRNPEIGTRRNKDGENSDALEDREAYTDTIDNIPSLEWFQAIPNGNFNPGLNGYVMVSTLDHIDTSGVRSSRYIRACRRVHSRRLVFSEPVQLERGLLQDGELRRNRSQGETAEIMQ